MKYNTPGELEAAQSKISPVFSSLGDYDNRFYKNNDNRDRCRRHESKKMVARQRALRVSRQLRSGGY